MNLGALPYFGARCPDGGQAYSLQWLLGYVWHLPFEEITDLIKGIADRTHSQSHLQKQQYLQRHITTAKD